VNALGFVLGFTLVFTALGALAGTLGSILIKYQTIVNIVCGAVVIFFGLNFLGILKLNLFRGMSGEIETENMGFFSAMLFGMIFSVGWTPCVGAFLGSALMMASTQGQILKGVVMLLGYSLGLGIPFLISAVLIDKLKSAFLFIKKNYYIINVICGIFLIIVGIGMASGVLGRLLSMFS
jgi:cytochrome c-type biogenesis protein